MGIFSFGGSHKTPVTSAPPEHGSGAPHARKPYGAMTSKEWKAAKGDLADKLGHYKTRRLNEVLTPSFEPGSHVNRGVTMDEEDQALDILKHDGVLSQHQIDEARKVIDRERED